MGIWDNLYVVERHIKYYTFFFLLFYLHFFVYDYLIETEPLGSRFTRSNKMLIKIGCGQTAEDAYERQRFAGENQGRLHGGGDF